MTTSGDSSSSTASASPSQSQNLKEDNLPPGLMDIVGPALQFGGLSGMF